MVKTSNFFIFYIFIVFYNLNYVKRLILMNLTVPIRFKKNDFRKRNYCFNVVLCILSASKKLNISWNTHQISKIELNYVTNSIRTVQLKNWSIWTYFASAEAFLPKISLFTKIEVDRDQENTFSLKSTYLRSLSRRTR